MFILYKPKIDYIDKSKLLKNENYIFVCNHTSHDDGPLLGSVFLKFTPYVLIAKDWYDKKFLGALLKLYGSVPVNRFELDTKWFSDARKVLKDNKSFIIFPEGRTSKADMSDFKPGFAILAMMTVKKVVPCAVHGKYSFFHRTKITVGTPDVIECPKDIKKSEYAENAAKKYKDTVEALKRH